MVSLPPHRVILTPEQIQRRVDELAEEIKRDLGDKTPLVVVVLKGAFIFAADLVRRFDFPYELDFIATSSYGDATESTGVVKLLKDLDEPVKGRTVLLVEDIIDTGLTLHYLYELLQIRQPERLEVAAFLSKRARRSFEVPVKYIGFEIPNLFVVGYGLDYNQMFRGLPYVVGITE